MKILLLLLIFVAKFSFGQTYTPQQEQLIKQALTFEDRGDYVNAIRTHLQIYNLDHANYPSTNSMAGLFGKMGDFRLEIVWAQKTIEINPQFMMGYINLGNGYTGQGNVAKATEYYTKAANLDPKSPLPPYSLGVLEESKENYKGAIEYYQQSVNLDPTFGNGYFNLAAAYANLGNFIKANESIKMALKLNPDNRDALEMQKHIITHLPKTKEI